MTTQDALSAATKSQHARREAAKAAKEANARNTQTYLKTQRSLWYDLIRGIKSAASRMTIDQ
jgi:hypothetical protein